MLPVAHNTLGYLPSQDMALGSGSNHPAGSVILAAEGDKTMMEQIVSKSAFQFGWLLATASNSNVTDRLTNEAIAAARGSSRRHRLPICTRRQAAWDGRWSCQYGDQGRKGEGIQRRRY